MPPTVDATRVHGTRQDTFVLRVDLNGVHMGIWDKKTGGALDSDDIKYFPGRMAQPISLGGKRTTDNVTLQRNYDRLDDHDKIGTWLAAAGKGQIKVFQRPMDPDGNEYGATVTWSGVLKRVFIPDVDSESTTAALFEIEVGITGYPVVSA